MSLADITESLTLHCEKLEQENKRLVEEIKELKRNPDYINEQLDLSEPIRKANGFHDLMNDKDIMALTIEERKKLFIKLVE